LRLHLTFRPLLRAIALSSLLACAIPSASLAQQAPQKPSEKPTAKPSSTPEKSESPYQIELLETHYRFEASGDSRKEVHTRVHINNELGVRQFARLNFDHNRSFQSIEIPLVHITHPSGGTADILPSAITDNPNPAVVNAPAYQDVRIKSVRLLGLEPGDTLEYRVITTTTHHPLAPDFWLDHSFDRSGVVTQEIFELDLPASIGDVSPINLDANRPGAISLQDLDRSVSATGKVVLYVNPQMPATSTPRSGEGSDARVTYLWIRSPATTSTSTKLAGKPHQPAQPDIEINFSYSWADLSHILFGHLSPPGQLPTEIRDLSARLTQGSKTLTAKAERIYDFVSQKISTINLPLGATGFRARPAVETLESSYGIAEDKFTLFEALARAAGLNTYALLAGDSEHIKTWVPTPTSFNHLFTWVTDSNTLLDLNLEVAPFRIIPSNFRGREALNVGRYEEASDGVSLVWTQIPMDLPFVARQEVDVDTTLEADGKLAAKVHYSLRGDNELLLRVAFHQAPKEKWKDLAQLLALSDGFRGQVTSVTASDPYATKEPFTVDYEIVQPKFVDWSKKPVRIPALLPQLGLPDPPSKPASDTAALPIELGTPLEVETHMTLHVPPGTTIATPTGTSVIRDYARFASQYSAKGQTVTASRHINFLQRQVPPDRAADYNAFLHAVQNDQAQGFTLDRESTRAPATKPASTATPLPTRKP